MTFFILATLQILIISVLDVFFILFIYKHIFDGNWMVLNKNINQNEFDNQYKFYDSLQSPLSNNFNYSKIDRPES